MSTSSPIITAAIIGFADPDDASIVTNGDGYVSWYDDTAFACDVFKWAHRTQPGPILLVAGMSLTQEQAQEGRQALVALGLAPTPAPVATPKERAARPKARATKRSRAVSPSSTPTGMVSRAELKRAMQLVRKVAPTTSSNPILSCVRIKGMGKEDGGFSLFATDAQTYLTHPMNGHFEGDIIVNAKALADTLGKGLPKGARHVKLTKTGTNTLTIEAGTVTRTLTGENRDDYPAWPDMPGEGSTVIVGETFGPKLRRVSMAMSSDENRYGLCGIHFEHNEEDGSLMVATDGSRLHLAKAKTLGDTSDALYLPPKMLLPCDSVPKVLALVHPSKVKPGPAETLIYVGDRWMRFRTDRASMMVRLTDGDFPDWRYVLSSKDPMGIITVDRATLEDAMRTMDGCTTDRNHSVKVEFYPDRMKLSTHSVDVGDMSMDVTVSIEGNVSTMGLNASYMLDGIQATTGELVRLEVGEALSPIIVGEGTDKAVVMPMRID